MVRKQADHLLLDKPNGLYDWLPCRLSMRLRVILLDEHHEDLRTNLTRLRSGPCRFQVFQSLLHNHQPYMLHPPQSAYEFSLLKSVVQSPATSFSRQLGGKKHALHHKLLAYLLKLTLPIVLSFYKLLIKVLILMGVKNVLNFFWIF